METDSIILRCLNYICQQVRKTHSRETMMRKVNGGYQDMLLLNTIQLKKRVDSLECYRHNQQLFCRKIKFIHLLNQMHALRQEPH